MNTEEAENLLRKQPVGTILTTAVPDPDTQVFWKGAVLTKKLDGWTCKPSVELFISNGPYLDREVAPILAGTSFVFIWSFS